jgi:predicted LPLAT superfamily acyltransferase
MEYKFWLTEFSADKTHVATFERLPYQALHSISRYLDQQQHVWETGITYTDRLVVRSGKIDADGVTIQWSEWKTLHDVVIPKQT